MRVLWFVPVPPEALARAAGASRPPAGTWLSALEESIRGAGGLELHIAASVPRPVSIRHAGVTYHGLMSRPRPRLVRGVHNWLGWLGDGSIVRSASCLARELAPDVIHVHGTERSFGCLNRMVDAPTIISLQGVCTVYERMAVRGMETLPLAWLAPGAVLSGGTPLHRRMSLRAQAVREREMLRRARFVGGRTLWDRAVASILAPDAEYLHCGELLRPEFYGPEWRHDDGRGLRVYATIGCAPYKGVETLLESIHHLRDLGRDAHLRLGGLSGDDHSGRAAQRIARKLGIDDSVELLGRLTGSEIVEELLGCSVYVSPSHIENSPNSLCEAQRLGVPCVATGVGGVPSLVENGRSGVLVQDGDSWHMAAEIARLYDDPALAIGMGSLARETSSARHDVDRVVSELLSAYSHVVRRANSNRSTPRARGAAPKRTAMKGDKE